MPRRDIRLNESINMLLEEVGELADAGANRKRGKEHSNFTIR